MTDQEKLEQVDLLESILEELHKCHFQYAGRSFSSHDSTSERINCRRMAHQIVEKLDQRGVFVGNDWTVVKRLTTDKPR